MSENWKKESNKIRKNQLRESLIKSQSESLIESLIFGPCGTRPS